MTTPVGEPTEHDIVTDTLRELWTMFPSMRPLLEDTTQRRRMADVLLDVPRSGEHAVDDCLAVVVRQGYHVSSRRPATPKTAPGPADPAPVRTPTNKHSQAGRLLLAYYQEFAETGAARGLTAEEARAKSGLSVRSCFWKRVGELRDAGLIEPMRDEHDASVTRPGLLPDSQQQVNTITAYGRSIAVMMED